MELEVDIISGKMNPGIQPHLEVWEIGIPSYFFFGGLAAGVLILSGLYRLAGKQDEYPVTVRYAPLLAPVALGIGLALLMLDLSRMWHFWRLFLTFKLASPISWGTWLLTVLTPLSVVYAFIGLRRADIERWLAFGPIPRIHELLQPLWRPLAAFLVVCSIGVGIYTGVLLSSLTARPFWNSPLLGLLFLASAITTGGAAGMLMTRQAHERHEQVLLLAIKLGIELVVVFLFVLGHAVGGAAGQEVVRMLLGGEMTLVFLVFYLSFGMLAPLALVLFHLGGWARYTAIAPALVIFGGAVLRFAMVHGGQVTRWLPY